jgi:hypothetical protein
MSSFPVNTLNVEQFDARAGQHESGTWLEHWWRKTVIIWTVMTAIAAG